MRHLKSVVVVLFFLLIACTGPGGVIELGGWEATECTVYADVGATAENSLIAQRIPDPCQAQKLLGTAAKLGVVWEAYEVEQFDEWALLVENYLRSGVTYNDLMLYVSAEVAKLNKKLGGTFIILGDLILKFPDKTLIMEKDITLALMCIEDLRAQVAKMKLIS